MPDSIRSKPKTYIAFQPGYLQQSRIQQVYYTKLEDRALYATNVDTGSTRKIAVLPFRTGIDTVNADETLAAGTYVESNGQDYGGTRREQTHPLDQPRNKGEMMEPTLAAHLPRVLFTVNLQTGEQKIILHGTDWLSHLLLAHRPDAPDVLP